MKKTPYSPNSTRTKYKRFEAMKVSAFKANEPIFRKGIVDFQKVMAIIEDNGTKTISRIDFRNS